jgi:carbonic anhydrase
MASSALRFARRALGSAAVLAASVPLAAAASASPLPPLPLAPTAPPAAAARAPAAAAPPAPAAAAPPAPSAAAPVGFDGSTSRLEAMLAHNERFVREGAYSDFAVAPANKMAPRCVILTCMDSRLTHLLPAALNIKQGDSKIVKVAGAVQSHPFGGVMRSILVALYELRASEVFIIGHDDCGMRNVDADATIAKMVAAGVPADRVSVLKNAGVDVHAWLQGFASVDESVLASVEAVRRHPLVPPGLRVTGLVIDPVTGALRRAGERPGAPHSH